ncbi:MAG: FecR family protein [Myxococcota bacterium]
MPTSKPGTPPQTRTPLPPGWFVDDERKIYDRRQLAVPPRVDSRVDDTWTFVVECSERSAVGPRRLAIASAGSAIVAAAVAVLAILTIPRGSPWVGEALISGDHAVEVTLPDGTHVVAEANTQLVRVKQESREVSLRLDRGHASFDVTPDPDRVFIVWARDIEVRVVGTRFTVARTDGEIAVGVEHGAVDVRRGAHVERLRAGERRNFLPRGQDLSPRPLDAATVPMPPPRPPAEPRAVPLRTSAELLFRQAATARRDGRPHHAAELYGQLLQDHPQDERTAIAALELARLRMDVLGEPARAVLPLRIAARRGGASAAAEDSWARLVEVHDALGQHGQCAEALDQYQQRFPLGAHRHRLDRLCN